MASISVFAPIDMRQVDLNWYVRNTVYEELVKNAYFVSPSGRMYPDVYFVEGYSGGYLGMGVAGTGLSINPWGASGTVNGVMEYYWSGDQIMPTWFIEDVSIPASSLYNAAWTFSNSDELGLIAGALSGHDDVILFSGGNVIATFGGNDHITASLGSDIIDAGAGFDTVYYAGSRMEHDVEWLPDGAIVVNKPAFHQDLLFSVEKTQFSDGALIFDIGSANLDMTYRMYAAAYGRTPDEGGLRFWIDVMDRLDREQPWVNKLDFLADQFLAAEEYQILYGSNPSNRDYVDAMYWNVLNRTPDQGGYDYWVGRMEEGAGRDDILVVFSESIENQSNTAPDLNDGVWIV